MTLITASRAHRRRKELTADERRFALGARSPPGASTLCIASPVATERRAEYGQARVGALW